MGLTVVAFPLLQIYEPLGLFLAMVQLLSLAVVEFKWALWMPAMEELS